MENEEKISTLKVKICGSIISPPDDSREQFKQGVIDTVLHLLRTEDVSIEYIGYRPAPSEESPLNSTKTYEDCVYVSLNVRGAHLNPMDGDVSKEDIVKTFVAVFEDKTHRHLEIRSTMVREGKQQRMIEMSSDWKYYKKHG